MKRQLQFVGGLNRCESGTAAIEFAVIGLVMVLFCVGIVEFGRGLHIRNELSFAADIAARKILINPSVSNNVLDHDIRSAFKGNQPELLEVTLGTEAEDGVQFRTVLIRYPFSLLVPGLGGAPISLSLARRIPIGA